MQRIFILLLFIIKLSVLYTFSQKNNINRQEVDYVNNLIGTAEGGAGGVMPCIGLPFPMTNFSPQTNENMVSRMPYLYDDSTMIGFIATHQPTVWMGDYGYVTVMPQIGKLKVLPNERKLSFNHSDEVSKPYQYKVKLKADNNRTIKTEMTATERCGILKFTFPQSKASHIIIQALNINDTPDPDWMKNLNSRNTRLEKIEAFVHIDKDKNEITGYNPDRVHLNIEPKLKNFKGYFIIQFDKPFTNYGIWNNDTIINGKQEGLGKKRLGTFVSYSTKNNETIKVKIATSFISLAQARENLNKEIPDWDFERVAIQTRNTWQKTLEKIKLEGVTEKQKTIFYTAFYHTHIFPRQFSEYGKYYSAFDDTIHEGVAYNDFSLWDTFRALHPFLIFMQPDRVNDMIASMLNMYKEGGWLPMWPNPAETNIMIGTHADAVIADAYIKGVRGYDVKLAYEAMRKDAFLPNDCESNTNKFWDRQIWGCYEGRAGLPLYHSLGYIPSDYKAESVSRTIEYGIDDYAVAQVAKDLGKTDDYERLMQWSKNYKNLYNTVTGFLAPRLFNGQWDKNPNEGFTEGSPWTYLFGAAHDVPGQIALFGGKDKFIAKLDSNFQGKHYAHDNEPGHHYIYLYDYVGQAWKTQALARTQTEVNYFDKPTGINGNDDCGQMSAWYIFNVMGFYPSVPASGLYSIGAPQYPKITMNFMADGKPRKLEIIANHISVENKYIQSLMLDGKPVTSPFISHKELINTDKMVFEMGAKPNENWK